MINLLPTEAKQAVRYARLNVSLIQYCVLVILTSAALSAMLLLGINIMSSTQNEIETSIESDQAKIAELELINSQANELAADIDTISRLLQQEVKFSELIREIGLVIPAGASLSGLTLTEDRTAPLSLEVATTNPDLIGVLQENMRESDLFLGAEILSITATQDTNGTDQFSGSLNAYFNNETVVDEAVLDQQTLDDAFNSTLPEGTP